MGRGGELVGELVGHDGGLVGELVGPRRRVGWRVGRPWPPILMASWLESWSALTASWLESCFCLAADVAGDPGGEIVGAAQVRF